MFSICPSSISLSTDPERWRIGWLRPARRPNRRIRLAPMATPSSMNDDSVPLDYDPPREPLGFETDLQSKNNYPGASKLRSWFGPNGQYIRELPCPSCRGRGYTPCTECGIERSRSDCSQCNGKGLRTCLKCMGDCVIWEESIDERPWEKARTSSPLKVKEDDEVDNLEIKLDITRKSKRVYQSPSPEVSSKISRSLRSLNAKTGLFSKRMKIIHQDPTLHAQRVAAIKKAKGTSAARMQASESMKAFFRDPENRLKRSIAMKGAKFYCSHCSEEGHRRHYCPKLRENEGEIQLRCRQCGERGHNTRTCGRPTSSEDGQMKGAKRGVSRVCGACGQTGHNRRTCPRRLNTETENRKEGLMKTELKRSYSCSHCLEKGHNIRRCPKRGSYLKCLLK